MEAPNRLVAPDGRVLPLTRGTENALILMKFPWVTTRVQETAVPGFQVVSLDEIRGSVIRSLRTGEESTFFNYCKNSNELAFNDTVENDYIVNNYICFQGAEYIAWLWMGADPQLFRKTTPTTKMALEQIAYLRGVYQFELEIGEVESHAFVLEITEADLTVYNSYGGTPGFFITNFSRQEWVKTFLGWNSLSLEEQLATYHELWGFTYSMIDHIRERRDEYSLTFQNLQALKIY